MKNPALFLFIGLILLTATSCKRSDGITVVEGQAVDKFTGKAVPNATIRIYTANSKSFISAPNTLELEKKADSKGNFSFSFESDNSRDYALRAGTDKGYSTLSDDIVFLKEDRNNKKLKVKMQPPAWVRVKLVNVPPKNLIKGFYMQSFEDHVNGDFGFKIFNFHSDTTFIRRTIPNSRVTFLVNIDTIGNRKVEYMIRLNPSAYFSALDTTDLILQY